MTKISIGTPSTLTAFDFSSLPLRAIVIEGEPWFVAKDVCDVLQYTNVSAALAKHVDDEDRRPFNLNTLTNRDSGRGAIRVALINESGLYSLILSSKKPEAKKFKRWVTSVVLPSIRMHGAYVVGVEALPVATQQVLLARFKAQTVEALRRYDHETEHDHWMKPERRAAHSLQQQKMIAKAMALPLDVVQATVHRGVDAGMQRLTQGVSV